MAVAAWFVVAHSSGDGWVQALGSLLTGFLVVGLVGPAFAVRRARCAVTDSPVDAIAGRPCELTLTVTPGVVVQVLDPPGPALASGARGEGEGGGGGGGGEAEAEAEDGRLRTPRTTETTETTNRLTNYPHQTVRR